MKANLVSETLHNFERNQEPLKSMGIGVTRNLEKFFGLMPKSLFSQGNQFWEDWVRMKEILEKPTTSIQFHNPLQEAKIREDRSYVKISLPPDPLNWFFFKGLILMIYSHSPKKLTKRSIQPNSLTLYINEDA